MRYLFEGRYKPFIILSTVRFHIIAFCNTVMIRYKANCKNSQNQP